MDLGWWLINICWVHLQINFVDNYFLNKDFELIKMASQNCSTTIRRDVCSWFHIWSRFVNQEYGWIHMYVDCNLSQGNKTFTMGFKSYKR